MKAPTFILKKIHIERESDREFESHMQRLRNIKSSLNVKDHVREARANQKRSNSHHQQAQRFKEELRQRTEKLANRALINKLLEINDGKYSIINQLNQQNIVPQHTQVIQTQPITTGSDANAYEQQQPVWQVVVGSKKPPVVRPPKPPARPESEGGVFVGDDSQEEVGANGDGARKKRSSNVNHKNSEKFNVPSDDSDGARKNSREDTSRHVRGASEGEGGRRINRSLTAAPQAMANAHKKREMERIVLENQALAERMLRLPPVINKKKLDQEYKEHKKIRKIVQRFHVHERRPLRAGTVTGSSTTQGSTHANLNTQASGVASAMRKHRSESEQVDDGLDETNQELMALKIHVVIRLIDISFINFLPVNSEEEKYYLEIRAGSKPLRKTTPEMYMDFSKSIINEFFLLKELKNSKLCYIALYQKKETSADRFLGDFELDLTPYYMENCTREIHHDLRNWREMHNLPSYMPKDMRRKGWIDFELIVRSNVKQYLDNLQKVDEQAEDDDEDESRTGVRRSQ